MSFEEYIREVRNTNTLMRQLVERLGELAEEKKEPPSFRMPLLTPFNRPHQYKAVAAETKNDKVFDLNIPGGNMGFIQWVANTHVIDNVLYWKIDGKNVEERIERAVGTMANPRQITPWFRLPVAKNIVWTVDNNDSAAHNYEVLCMGFWVRPEDLPILFQLAAGVWVQ